ncbi:hypothetical protein [Faecalibaculum rodentium]|uniref:hypothetical protein n=1 Tax=Faecalibaculum rodentium TaxID=1702221 RepID=UPI0023F2F846|nr:hypothetical protein [Faecalibaculum rodentium]
MKQKSRKDRQSGSAQLTARRLFEGGLVLMTVLGIVIGGNAFREHRRVVGTREQAVAAATDLIATTYVSRAGVEDTLAEQALALEWPEDTVDWAMEQLAETDWTAEALEAALAQGTEEDISEKALENRLMQLQFTTAETDAALSGVSGRFDYDARAVSSLKHCAEEMDGSLSRRDGRSHLEHALFTESQVQMALDSDTVNWQTAAEKQAGELLQDPLSRKGLEAGLSQAEFTTQEIRQAVDAVDPDFALNCTRYLRTADPDNCRSLVWLREAAQNRQFEEPQIAKALESRDFRYNAVRLAGQLTASCSETMSKEDLSRELKAAEFTDEEQAFVMKYYDESAGEMPGESAIRDKIRQEEEAKKKAEEQRKKAEEEEKKKAEEEQRRAQEAAQKAAEEAAAAAQAPSTPQTDAATVWIPRTGSKYHSNPNCSNMKSPSAVTIDQAMAWGYDRCKKCW